MKVYYFKFSSQGFICRDTSAAQRPVVLALGCFDGLHRGHQKIIKATVEHANNDKLCPAVFTFVSPPPTKTAGADQGDILSHNEKLCAFEKMGIEAVYFFPFDSNMENMTPHVFVDQILHTTLNARALVAGEDFYFGKGKAGAIGDLVSLGRHYEIKVYPIPCVIHDGKKISSSGIRSYLLSAQLDKARHLLGYPFFYTGMVEPGKGLGRLHGFPTANIRPEKEKIIIKKGVYVSYVIIHDAIYPAATNIGTRPTLHPDDVTVVVESMILDRAVACYDKDIRVVPQLFIREEKRFSHIDELSAQVQKDLLRVRQYHDTFGSDYSFLNKSVI